MPTDAQEEFTDAEGIEAIIELRSMQNITETPATARVGWDAMSPHEKMVTVYMYRSIKAIERSAETEKYPRPPRSAEEAAEFMSAWEEKWGITFNQGGCLTICLHAVRDILRDIIPELSNKEALEAAFLMLIGRMVEETVNRVGSILLVRDNSTGRFEITARIMDGGKDVALEVMDIDLPDRNVPDDSLRSVSYGKYDSWVLYPHETVVCKHNIHGDPCEACRATNVKKALFANPRIAETVEKIRAEGGRVPGGSNGKQRTGTY